MAVRIQNHLHLDTTIGGAPENAPTATYKAFGRRKRSKVNISFNRGENGTPHVSRQRKSGGDIIVFMDWSYTIKATEAEVGTLEGLIGQTVSLVDHLHPDDGEDHDSYIRTMVFVDMSEPKMANTVGIYYELDIFLQDVDSHL
jgi:hypothetical protein